MKAASSADHIKQAVQFMYENEGLTSSLTDDAAKLLLEWGAGQLNSLPATEVTPEDIDAFAKSLRRVMRYINKVVGDAQNPDTGYEDLHWALSSGEGAVSELLGRHLPRYRPPPAVAGIEDALGRLRPAVIASLALDWPVGVRGLKFFLFFFAGLCVAFALGAAWRGERDAGPRLSRSNPFVVARDALTGFVGAFVAWMLVEPDVLRGATEKNLPGVRLEFAVADTLESLKSPMTAMQNLNEVTLLVLVLFFVVQLIIYALCLIKLREIGKQDASASLKLSLLENEENLFDFGLYVGLGGTVASLILVAIGIVEASLMAAYASTLFGILCVAMIKIFHVRPVRRQLIIEAARQQG